MTLAEDTAGVEVEVSLLVPAKDEADSLAEFVSQCEKALKPLPYSCELVVIDDGSNDGTAELLRDLSRKNAFLRTITHRTRRGIADALKSGSEIARGSIFVFYPADLQFSPNEIPSLVEPIRSGEADMVTGTKQGQYEKAFVSGIYNRICRWMFGVRVSDLNAVKAYRREVMEAVPARPDWHRFMVPIAAADGFRLTERPVTLHPRLHGQSKFGIGRIPVGMLDLMSVWFQLRFGRKPLLFFGVPGGILMFLGLLVGLVAIALRIGGVGLRPLLSLTLILVISGIALFGFGFIGELLAGQREELRSLSRTIERLSSDRPQRKP
ncbi:MAG: glycosyltransferase family 2 protein [Gemmatimonadota bacterium]|nr:MAG: glycosyltransferase family 2 protein [Gemmatimonadota bacterium]